MRRGTVFGAGIALCLASVAVEAAVVSVDPIRVHLSGQSRSQSLRLTNSGQERLRFQVSVFDWQQSDSGEMRLGPTQELAFFPSMLELAPGETRKIRVVGQSGVGSVEKSYRLFIDELPPVNAGNTGAVRVLTRLGVPVFLQPEKPKAEPALSASVQRAKLVVVLQNRGTSYFLARSLRVIGRSPAGSVVKELELPVWYVLAQGRRTHEVQLAKEVCSELAELTLTAKTDHGVVQASYRMPADACRTP